MSTQIDQLATELGELLLKHKGLLATAESCTGGLLAGAATAIAGTPSTADDFAGGVFLIRPSPRLASGWRDIPPKVNTRAFLF